MNDGRKTRRQGVKNDKAKLDREWQQISQVREGERRGKGRREEGGGERERGGEMEGEMRREDNQGNGCIILDIAKEEN